FGRLELGLVQVEPGVSPLTVQEAMQRSLPNDVRIWTRTELIAQEVRYWRLLTPVGFIFNLGLVVGFVVGVVICSQILYTSVVDRMSLLGMLKAIGYTNGYVVTIVMREALLLSVLGFLPAVVASAILYDFLASITGFKMILTVARVLLVMGLTIGMS